MKTRIPRVIKTKEVAERFIDNLVKNEEAFHFEDDAFDIVDKNGNHVFDDLQARRMNVAVSKMYDIEGFDPCAYYVDNHLNLEL